MEKKSKQSVGTSEDVNAILYQHLERIRPPEDIRPKLDVGYSYQNNVIEFFEIRPDWQDATIIRQFSYVKIKFVKARNHWKLYWLRASGKWEPNSPLSTSTDLQEILDCVEDDAYRCFHG